MIEETILSNLVNNEEYTRRVAPFLKSEYFDDKILRTVFDVSLQYFTDYNGLPTKEALNIELENITSLSDSEYSSAKDVVNSLNEVEGTDLDWLLEKTEAFCKDKAVYNAVKDSIQILNGNSKELDKGAIPNLLSDALAISFDTSVGHDYVDDFLERYDFYHSKEERIAFDLDIFNKITNGGLPKKSLSVGLASTGVGKTLFMTHCASSMFMEGKNVLYITMEMAEERIAERVDANLLDLSIQDLNTIPKESFTKRVERIKSKSTGKLVVKEYPTGGATANHFRYLLNELKTKKNFKPDIIFVDYLNICGSSRLKGIGGVNSYNLNKAIAEELRGLAMEFDVPLVTATQTNRTGSSSSDLEMTDTSDSFGIPFTADFMFGLVTSEELEAMGQIMVKQLKNRWNDTGYYRRFVVGVDRSKMKLYDVDDPQDGLTDDSPMMDRGAVGERLDSEIKSNKSKKKPNFDDLK